VGGFVDLVGEHPEAESGDDPRGLCNKPAWQRVVVFSAGVAMNALLALVLFTAAPIVGIQVMVPIAGGVAPDMPAAKAGIQAGDRLVRINGEPVESFMDIVQIIGMASAGTSFDIELERPAADAQASQRRTVTVASTRAPGSDWPMIGVEPERDPVIGQMHADSLAQQAGLEAGDRILAVNAAPVDTWRGLVKALADAPAGPVTLALEREGQRQDLRIDPAELKTYDYGMAWTTAILSVEPNSPAAAAGIEAGDRIAAIQGKPWPATEAVSETVKAAGADAVIRLTLWRGGKYMEVSAKTAMLPTGDHPRLGVFMGPALDKPVQVGSVDVGGPADKAGLRPGDILRLAGEGGDPPKDWNDLSKIFVAAGDKPIPLQVERGAAVLNTSLLPARKPQERLSLAGTLGEYKYVPLPRIYNPVVAAERGVKRTGMWFARVYANLRQLLTRQVSTKAVGGPVAIIQMSLGVAAYGLGTFMDFWGMLAVMIAVLNFLPLPPFDGGHVLFVLLESIKGSPISLRVRTYIWGAGWAAVGVLFLLVMWQDIARAIS
jgi:regulator of sigma E protease